MSRRTVHDEAESFNDNKLTSVTVHLLLHAERLRLKTETKSFYRDEVNVECRTCSTTTCSPHTHAVIHVDP